MKKSLFLLAIALLLSGLLCAQNNKNKYIEILYFKANLACCKAKACNALESEIQAFVTKNFPKGNVIFTEIKLAEDSNKVLVEKYKAQSQTVIIVKHVRKKEFSADVTDVVKKYVQDQNKAELEKAFVAKINEFLN